MKWTLEELQELIKRLCERLSSHDLHSHEYVDGLVDEIQNEITDKKPTSAVCGKTTERTGHIP